MPSDNGVSLAVTDLCHCECSVRLARHPRNCLEFPRFFTISDIGNTLTIVLMTKLAIIVKYQVGCGPKTFLQITSVVPAVLTRCLDGGSGRGADVSSTQASEGVFRSIDSPCHPLL